MLKKVGSWIGTTKRYISSIQNEVADFDLDINDSDKKKDNDTNNDKI
jgi:sec-independent protein translocase protein TatB